MIKEKQEMNKTNQHQFPFRTDSVKFELLYKDSISKNKSMNLTLNDIVDWYFKINPTQ